MASVKLPWTRVWETLWRAIPDPLTAGRLLLALDDSLNPKTGRKVFGCQTTFDHAAKANQSRYPWAQTIVTVEAGFREIKQEDCGGPTNRRKIP
jgi:hypothetical protein